MPRSGWPFGPDEIAPYLDRASRHLGAGPYVSHEPSRPHLNGPVKIDFDASLLESVCWSFGRDKEGGVTRFGKLFRRGTSDNVRVIVHATVTHVNTNAEGTRVEGVDIADVSGRRATVTARSVVLCAGGIENARILLCSNRQRPGGLGNEHDLVGRFLMDHPRDLRGAVEFDPRDTKTLLKAYGHYLEYRDDGWRELVRGVALSKQAQRREELLNCAAWPFFEAVPADPVAAARRLKKRASTKWTRDAWLVASNLDIIGKVGYSWMMSKDEPIRPRFQRAFFVIGSEQVPDPDSRITLTQTRDALGLPVVQTAWRINDQEIRTQVALANAIEREFRRLGLPRPKLADWVRENRPEDASLVDGCHPTGTTKMSRDPKTGVVDPDCQLHGVDSLFIAGSSVFPTAGHANPTLMIVAMAVRLADHLKSRFAAVKSTPLHGRHAVMAEAAR